MLLLQITLIFLLSISSCNNSSSSPVDNQAPMYEYGEDKSISPDMQSDNEPLQKVKEESVTPEKKIIKEGRISINVSDIEKSKTKVNDLVSTNSGYYANESFNNSDYESTYNLQIRIPSKNFEKFIKELEDGKEEIVFKEITAQDVTTQYIDIELRLENKRSYLTRYKELLSQAKSVNEILEIEEKIRVLQEEIESAEGQLKYLASQVSFSTLNLSIQKIKPFKYSRTDRGSFFEKLKLSLSSGWYGFVDFTLFMLNLWPFAILIAVTFFLFKKWRRRKS